MADNEAILLKEQDDEEIKPILYDVKKQNILRTKTGFDELDRVLGGGLVKGSLTLLRRRTRYWKIYFNLANMR